MSQQDHLDLQPCYAESGISCARTILVDSISAGSLPFCAVTSIERSPDTALQIHTYFAFFESAPLACLYYSLSDLEDVQRTLGRTMRLWRKWHIVASKKEKVGRWMQQRSKKNVHSSWIPRIYHVQWIILIGIRASFKSRIRWR